MPAPDLAARIEAKLHAALDDFHRGHISTLGVERGLATGATLDGKKLNGWGVVRLTVADVARIAAEEAQRVRAV